MHEPGKDQKMRNGNTISIFHTSPARAGEPACHGAGVGVPDLARACRRCRDAGRDAGGGRRRRVLGRRMLAVHDAGHAAVPPR